MATNEFLPFAVGPASNILTQDAYNELDARARGFTAGMSNSMELNKVWRQASVMSSVIGDYLVARTGRDVRDDGNLGALREIVNLAFGDAAIYVAATGSNVYGHWKLWSDGRIEQWGRLLVNSVVTVTDIKVDFPISFLSDTYEFICSSETKSTVGDGSYACCALNRRTLSSIYVSSRRTGGITTDNYITWRAVS